MATWEMEFRNSYVARLVAARLDRRGYITRRRGRIVVAQGEKRPWAELGYAPVRGPALVKPESATAE